MKILTKKEKQIWNDAVKATLIEMMNWDGIIPDLDDRKLLREKISEKISYKIKP
jgi:hypothetical protein